MENTNKLFKNNLPTAYVIGGAGFIGSYVCEVLCAQNVNVVALDDLSSGKQFYLEKLSNLSNFKFIEVNINNGFDPSWPKAEYIFHIGGIESYLNGVDLTINTMLVNSLGTYHSLEFAKKHKSKYLLVSSLDVYNGALSSLDLKKYFGLSERDGKRYTHHESKRYAEALTTEYYRKYELDARIVRIAETYGPRMDLTAGTDLAKLFYDAVHTDSLGVNGDGLKIIHPTYVSDVITGISKAMFSQNTSGKIYNLANPEEMNILNFAYAIQKNSTKPLKIRFTAEFKEISFPLHKIELAQSQTDLAWSAKTKTEDGITQTLEYFFLFNEKIEKTPNTPSPTTAPKQAEIPYTPVLKDKQVMQTTKEVPKKEDKPRKASKANIAILAVSLFIILLLFIFPFSALYISSQSAMQESLDSGLLVFNDNQKTNEKVIQAQKNIAIANVQFDNIEWFYSMIRQRDRFEGSRAVIQTADKFTRSLGLLTILNKDKDILEGQMLNGKLMSESVELNNRRMNEVLLNLENTLLESQSIQQTIFNQKIGNQLNSVTTIAKQILVILNNEMVVTGNARKYLASQQNRFFTVIFLDNTKPNAVGGVPYGFALIKTGSTGIKETKFFTTTETEYVKLVSDIKQKAESEKYGTIETVLVVNDTFRDSLISELKTVNNEKYAQVITDKNLQQKIKESPTAQYKTDMWEAVWNQIKKSTTFTKINSAITKGIKEENISILTQTADKTITVPKCQDTNLLKELFVLQSNSKEPQAYCVVPELTADVANTDVTQNLKLSAKLTPQEQQVTLINKIENKTDKAVVGTITLTVPGKPKLTNIQIGFPISFDKVKTNTTADKTTWTVEVDLKAATTTEIKFDWIANLSDGNIQKDGIYVEKQFSSSGITTTVEIEGNDQKMQKAESKNSDVKLIL